MSCSPKYNKLVEYLKTHYTYQLKLNSFSLGNRESTEDAVKRQVYGDAMEFIENLESEQDIKDRHKNNLIPLDFGHVNAADTVSLNFTTDAVTFGSATTYPVTLGGSDTLNIGTPLPGGMGEDHITFNSGLAHTHYDEPKYYSDVNGLVAGELPDDKDDK
jgi:hypothetical protein